MLYSQKKGQLSIKEYLFKIKHMRDVLAAAGTGISDQEQVSIVLVGLLIEYESVRVVASTTNVSLELLIEMSSDCETRKNEIVSNLPMKANVAQQQKSDESDQCKMPTVHLKFSRPRSLMPRSRVRNALPTWVEMKKIHKSPSGPNPVENSWSPSKH
ncbi:hypothetical protein Gotur_003322 [Gossypium turneri]